jgi:HK97 family phage prohead protease
MIEERRFYPASAGTVRLISRADGSKVIRGYGSVFWDPMDGGTQYQLYSDLLERVMPGAFDRALREGHDVRGLFNHDENCVLGRTASGTMKLSVDRRGLVYEIVPGDTSIARDVCAHLQRGDVSGSSFGFAITKQMFAMQDGMEIREIHDVQLYDTGPVTWPAYQSSTAEMTVSGSPTRAWFLPKPGAAPSFQ